jgi:hypothetical protein
MPYLSKDVLDLINEVKEVYRTKAKIVISTSQAVRAMHAAWKGDLPSMTFTVGDEKQ